MKCPKCGTKNTHYSTRKIYTGRWKRYYKCCMCAENYITVYESSEKLIKTNNRGRGNG